MAGSYVERFVGGKGKYMSHLYRQVCDLKEEYDKKDSFYDQIYILGEIGGIECAMEASYKKAVDLLVETKRDITEMLGNNDELFHYEVNFRKGFAAGIDRAIQESRAFQRLKIPIFILAFFENKELLDLFIMFALRMGFIEISSNDCLYKDNAFAESNMFFFTTVMNELIAMMDHVDSERYDLTLNIVCENKKHDSLVQHLSLLPVVEPFRLNIVRIKENCNVRTLFNELVKNVRF